MAVETDPMPPESAAVMIQKTYRGYRARRKLADAAIMAKEFGWWNLVDGAVLHEHTQQYYAHSKSFKAIEPWKRSRHKASKVGKGLSKDNKALKLALKHWLEAVDARHRYGQNLHPYYIHWLELDTHEPFFYWLDVGSGRQVELPKCSRAKLQEQQIKYLSPEQRKHYEVVIYKGKLFHKVSGELVHTPNADRYIFVMSPYGRLYIGKKEKGVLQHSSFLAGGATTAAGRLSVHHGVLQLMEAHSGHYRPSPENFEALVRILIESGADLALAKVQLVSDDMLEQGTGAAKELAGEVRTAIEETCADEHVEVKVENQRLVSLGSDLSETGDCLVTNLTFPTLEEAAKKTTDHEVGLPVKSKNEAQINSEEVASNDRLPQPQSQEDKVEVEEQQQEPNHEAVNPSLTKNPLGSVLPVDDMGQELQNSSFAVNLSKTPAVANSPGFSRISSLAPAVANSPGFSRISSLAGLPMKERQEALKKYGPK